MTCHLNVEPAKNHALRLIGQTMVAEGGFSTTRPLLKLFWGNQLFLFCKDFTIISH
jgi:hypothetical protein